MTWCPGPPGGCTWCDQTGQSFWPLERKQNNRSKQRTEWKHPASKFPLEKVKRDDERCIYCLGLNFLLQCQWNKQIQNIDGIFLSDVWKVSFLCRNCFNCLTFKSDSFPIKHKMIIVNSNFRINRWQSWSSLSRSTSSTVKWNIKHEWKQLTCMTLGKMVLLKWSSSVGALKSLLYTSSSPSCNRKHVHS